MVNVNDIEWIGRVTGQMGCLEARVTVVKGEWSEVPQQSFPRMQGVTVPWGRVYQALDTLIL